MHPVTGEAGLPRLLQRAACAGLGIAAFGVPLALLPRSTFSTLPKLLVFLVTAAVLMLLAAGRIAFSPRALPAGVGRSLLFLLLAIPLLALARFLGAPATGIGRARVLLLASGCTTVLSLAVLLDVRYRLVAALLILAGGVAGVALSILSGLGLVDWLGIYPSAVGRTSGSFGNANLLGGYAAALLPFGVVVLLSRRWSATVRVAASVAFASLCLAALHMSGTRSSLLGLLCALAAMAVLAARGSWSPPSGSKVVLICLAVLLLVSILLGGRLVRFDTAGTIGVRRVIWQGALRMTAARPLAGWGPGSFQRIFPLFRRPDYAMHALSPNTAHAHSEPLEILAEGGILMAALWLALLVLWGRSALRGLREDPIRAAALAACAAILIESPVSMALRWTPSAFLLAACAGLALETGDRRVRLPRLSALLPALAGVALLVLGVPKVLGMISASRHLYRAKVECLDRIESAPPDLRRTLALEAIEESNAALEADPGDLGAAFTLGNANLALSVELSSSRAYGEEAASHAEAALAAYDSLGVVASDYAEMRLNAALVAIMLGRYDRGLSELYWVARRKAHRRELCRNLGNSIIPLSAGYRGWALLTELNSDVVMLNLPDAGVDDVSGVRLEHALTSARCNLALVLEANAGPAEELIAENLQILSECGDSLLLEIGVMLNAEARIAPSARSLMRRLEAEANRDSLALECRRVVSESGAFAPHHRHALTLLAAETGDTTALKPAVELAECCGGLSLQLVQLWPGDGEFLEAGLQLAVAAGPQTHLREMQTFMEVALKMDMQLATTLKAAFGSSVYDSCGPAVVRLEILARGVGGPAAGRRAVGTGLLLAPGGMLQRMDSALATATGAEGDMEALLQARAGLLSACLCIALRESSDSAEATASYREAMKPVAAGLVELGGLDYAAESIEQAIWGRRRFLGEALADDEAARSLCETCSRSTLPILEAATVPQPR